MDAIRKPAAALLFLLPLAAAADLRVEGVGGELERNVRAYATLADEACNAETWRVRRRFRALEGEARAALEPFGYYQPNITVELTFDDECWNAMLQIDPGPQTRLREIDVSLTGESQSDPGFNVSATLPVSGDPLRHSDFDSYKRSLQVSAAARGYFDAEFEESRIDGGGEESAADIRLRFDTQSEALSLCG